MGEVTAMNPKASTTYVGDRSVLDADSHVMELADFLDEFIDPEFKDRLRVTDERLSGVLADAVAKSEARHSDAEKAKLAEERLLDPVADLRPAGDLPGAVHGHRPRARPGDRRPRRRRRHG